MKRRDFGLLASSSLATVAATPRSAHAQSATPDPTLLTTTLTPMGGERAGNADGSIPAWTGGLTSPPVAPDQPVAVKLFEDEKPLYIVNAANLAQYQNLLTPATQLQIQKYGLILKVYQCHRTAAAPQFVYDNTALNVTRAKLDPAGGRLGFTNAYGGVPFPIIDTSDPLIGGAQLIWNHLTAWYDYADYSLFNPGCVVINGKMILVAGTLSRTVYPYFDPKGSLETFDGYYSKGHYYSIAPGSVNGQEVLTWHSTNVNVNPDIVWTLLNGQGRVRKAPNEAFDAPNPSANGISNIDESSCFYGNPSQYDWTYISKQEMLVPYNCNAMLFCNLDDLLKANYPDPNIVRWEKHRMWVVEATLHPGEHNVISKRRYYIDEDSWYALLGEGYDGQGNLAKGYAIYNGCIPSVPGTVEQDTVVYDLRTGNYSFNGSVNDPPYRNSKFVVPQSPSDFQPQQMAAKAAF